MLVIQAHMMAYYQCGIARPPEWVPHWYELPKKVVVTTVACIDHRKRLFTTALINLFCLKQVSDLYVEGSDNQFFTVGSFRVNLLK